MSRKRFIAAQIIWFFTAIISGLAGSAGDSEMIPFVVFIAFIMSGFIMKWGKIDKEKNQDTGVLAYQGHVTARVVATALIWMSYLAGSVTAVMEMAGWGVLLALILMIPAIVFTGLLWAWERISGVADQRMQAVSDQQEKRKRERIDTVLRDLSDGDLLRLRERLSDGVIDEEALYDRFVGDDGELAYHQ